MKMRWKVALIVVAVACFAVALSYPIQYAKEEKENEAGMAQLAAIREAGRRRAEETTAEPEKETEGAEPKGEATSAPEGAIPRGQEPELPSGEALQAAREPAEDSNEAPVAAEESMAVSDEGSVSAQGRAATPNEAPQAAGAPAEVSDEEPVAAEESMAVSDGGSVSAQGRAATPNEAPQAAEAPAEVSDEEPVAAEKSMAVSDEGSVSAQGRTATPNEAPQAAEEPAEVSDEASVGVEKPTELSTELSNEASQAAEGTQAPEIGVELTGTPEPTAVPTATPDRRLRTKALPYPEMEKVAFDEANILPEFQELYAINPDLVGWITIPGTVIDYPVVQSPDSEFYLTHNFYGDKNCNGQIIMDSKCDPYTPSYNLVVSGHNMNNGSMFGSLVNYMYENYWKKHKTLQMDVLTEHREYVVFGAFFSADYDVDEEGFRYNVDIQYELDMRKWLGEIEKNQLYETGVEVEFGDEFLTLTTCNHARRKDGRFVLVCRRIREGEKIE